MEGDVEEPNTRAIPNQIIADFVQVPERSEESENTMVGTAGIMKKMHKVECDLILMEITVSDFFSRVSQTKGVMPIKFGNYNASSTFFGVDTIFGYNALLERDWIHSNHCIPSSLHQFLIQWNEDKVEMGWADNRPFVCSMPALNCFSKIAMWADL